MSAENFYKNVIIYQTPEEQEIFRDELNRVKSLNLKGELAEVGVFQGGTACIINEIIPDKELYLFDTFSGFADEIHESDVKGYKPGLCCADEKFVKDLMKDKKNVFITKGKFPDTSDIIKNKKFSFVHLDVDVYNGTKNSVMFFYPRLESGGSIIVHDYPHLDGVKKAIDELISSNMFEKDTIINCATRQLIIRK